MSKKNKSSFSILFWAHTLVTYTLLLPLIVIPLLQTSQQNIPIPFLENRSTTWATDHITVGLPVLIRITSINIDAPVESVGLTHTGAVDTPDTATNAAWYNLGPRPGERGIAVIVGHFGWERGSVFDHLYMITQGDAIIVVDNLGNERSFTVRELNIYDATSIIPEVFTSSSGLSQLNIITCHGIWNRHTQTYSQRLVVSADETQFTDTF